MYTVKIELEVRVEIAESSCSPI